MFRIDILLSLWSSISISYNLEVQAANVFGLLFSNISCTRLIKDPVSIRDRVVYNSLPLSFWIYERKYGVTRCPDRAGLREATSQRTRISTTAMFDFMKPLLLYYHPFHVALTNTIFCLFNTRTLSILPMVSWSYYVYLSETPACWCHTGAFEIQKIRPAYIRTPCLNISCNLEIGSSQNKTRKFSKKIKNKS